MVDSLCVVLVLDTLLVNSSRDIVLKGIGQQDKTAVCIEVHV